MKCSTKPVVMILLVIAIMAVMTGCQTKQAESTGSETEASTEKQGSDVIKEGTIQKDGNVILKELSFVYKDHNVAIADVVDDDQLESMLGEAVEKKTHTYSEDDGLNMDTLNGFTEKQYTFPGIEIKTINTAEGKKFSIFQIKITDPQYTTIRNIKVGDSVDTLKKAYPEGNLIGNGAPEEEDDFRYAPANYVDVMSFHIKDAKIESILMYTLLD